MLPSFPSQPQSLLLGATGPIHALTYSSSPGTYILTGSADRAIRLYNPFPRPAPVPSDEEAGVGRLIQTYAAHGYEVLDIAVARGNSSFSSVGGDRNVFLWDVSTAQTIRRFGGNQGHIARVNTVCFGGADDSVIVSGSFDTSVRIWDTKATTQRPIQVLDDARDSVSCVMIHSDGHEIVTGCVDGRVRYYDIRMGKMDTDVLGAPVTSLAAMKDREAVLVGTLDGAMRLLDRKNGSCLMTYRGHQNTEFRIRSCFGGRERWVLCGSEGSEKDLHSPQQAGEVVVWDTLTGKVLKRVAVEGRGEREDLESKGSLGSAEAKKKIGNVISCVAWRNNGDGDQWCCGGTDGVVTVFGE